MNSQHEFRSGAILTWALGGCPGQVAKVVAGFLTVHRGGGDGVAAASDALIQWQLKAAQIVDPFLSALGAHWGIQLHASIRRM